ncbi:MAG: FkbM family methyltransferase [Thermoproteota archaeon]|nr:FkbM family methyltransferase [Thermoproteota archaeon]
MRSILSELISWLKGCKYGYTYKDKIVLFLYILNGIIIIIFIIGIFGKNKLIDTYFKRTYLLNWIPVKSVLVKIDGAILSLPMILDYIILVKPDWEEKEREFMTQLNLNYNSNAIVMDIGANIGIYTILLSHIYPKAKIIAIEASPTIFHMLRSNCKLNNLLFPSGSNVLLINKAISDKDDITTEFYEKHSMSTMLKEFLTNLSSTILTNQDELNKKLVRTVTIDNLVETIGVNEISLLKIDVEGAEVLALKGAIKTLTHKKIKNMVIEYHSLENYNYIVKLLEEKELGYTIVNSQERFNKEKEFINGHIIAILQE